MDEKLIRSFIAGVIGGFVKDVIDLFFYYAIHFVNYRYLDFAAMILYGNKPTFWWDTIFAQFIELIFCGLLGIVFSSLIPNETNQHYLLKGWLFGVTIWLFLCSMGVIYHMPFFTKTPWMTTNSDFITSSIYGITLAGALRWLGKKFT